MYPLSFHHLAPQRILKVIVRRGPFLTIIDGSSSDSRNPKCDLLCWRSTMLCARKVCTVLTGFAFLVQTLFLPLAGNAETSKKSQVLVCAPRDLVTNEFWTYPYPGSEIDVFKKLL